ncbi:hypothetical protein [Butyrivibrio sp. WCD2001]|uniref:hypothetical protein n=1 Tax=Butyrivibrio sp. WCD2001 TaxID=1280681 RepID=UPI00041FA503|nr:hypothetical protein [Butyrivibrio sp. WCD2001]
MKKRGLKALITGCIMGMFLTGCGSGFPEMTQEEHDQIVQYAVSVLMKNSNNGVEKLSSLSSLELEKQMQKEDREAKKAARDVENAEKIANMPENPEEEEGNDDSGEALTVDESQTATELAQTEEPLQNPEVDDEGEQLNNDTAPETDVGNTENKDDIDSLLEKFGDDLDEGIENAGLETETKPEEETQDTAEPLPEDSSNTEITTEQSSENDAPSTEADKTVDGMRQELSKGIFLTYSGYSVAGTYPDNDDIFVINATQGKKLLILNFRLANTSGMDVSVDMEKANPHFQVILNGTNVGYTNVTMLDNDLSSYKGTIPSGAKLSMVLIKQMDASKLKNVESIGLIGDMGTETIQFNLE